VVANVAKYGPHKYKTEFEKRTPSSGYGCEEKDAGKRRGVRRIVTQEKRLIQAKFLLQLW